MNNRIKATIGVLAIGALGIGASACGTGEETATAADAPEPTTTEETTTTETEPVEVEESQADVDARIAEQYISQSPKQLAGICKGMNYLGEAKAAQMGERILGPQIIRGGGSPSEVVGIMLDRC